MSRSSRCVEGAASTRGVSWAFAIGLDGGRIGSAAIFVFEGSTPGQSGPLADGLAQQGGRGRFSRAAPERGLCLAQALQATHAHSHLIAPLIRGNGGLL